MLNFFLIMGAVCIVISGIFIGAWTNGEQQRADFFSETTNHRSFRTNIAMILGLIGIISFAISGAIYLFS